MLAMGVLLLAGWGAGEICRAALNTPDLNVVRDLAAQRTVVLTAIAHTLSVIGSAVVIGPLALVISIAFCCRGRGWPAVVIALSSGGGVLIVNVDKVIVGRPRPPVDQLVAARHSSFPSGHATVSAAFGVALSRVYLGVHYPTDVVGGMLFGATCALLVGLSPRDSELPPRAAVDDETTSASRDRSAARGEPPRTGAALRPGGRRPTRLWHPLWRYSWEPT